MVSVEVEDHRGEHVALLTQTLHAHFPAPKPKPAKGSQPVKPAAKPPSPPAEDLETLVEAVYNRFAAPSLDCKSKRNGFLVWQWVRWEC